METQTQTSTELNHSPALKPTVKRGSNLTSANAKKRTGLAKPAPKKVAKKVGTKNTGQAQNAQADANELNLKQLCNQLSKKLGVDIDPRMARRKLRKAKLAGHDFRDRWTFVPGSKAYEAAVKALTPATE